MENEQNRVGFRRLANADIEREFGLDDLVSLEPIGQFRKWYEDACAHEDIMIPNTIALSTASTAGFPSVRMVIIEGIHSDGFHILTEYGTPKSKDMDSNPYASFVVWWEPLGRSIRVEGTCERLADDTVDSYFCEQDRGLQLLESLGQCSHVIKNTEVMKEREAEIEKGIPEGSPVPRPAHWGGYVIHPTRVEFWQNKPNYRVDRLQFRRSGADEVLDPDMSHQGEGGWVIERLMP